MKSKKQTAREWAGRAFAYASSPGHARGADLDIILRFLQPDASMRVLDVATGPGHTAAAVAPFVRAVIATDLALGMVAQAQSLFAVRGLRNAIGAVMDAEALALPEVCFDAVTCRVAPHHFPDVRAAVREAARVLLAGGVFVLEDSCVPADPSLDRFLNDAEKLRDPTHVRSYTEAEWDAMLEAEGFAVTRREVFRKEHPFEHWLETAGVTEETAAAVRAAFAAASPPARERFRIRIEDGRPVSFTDDKLIVRAERRA